MDIAQLIDYKMAILELSQNDLVRRAKDAGYPVSSSTLSNLRINKSGAPPGVPILMGIAAAIEEHPFMVWVAVGATFGMAPPDATDMAATVVAEELGEDKRVYPVEPATLDELEAAHRLALRLLDKLRGGGVAGHGGAGPGTTTDDRRALPAPRGVVQPAFVAPGELATAEG